MKCFTLKTLGFLWMLSLSPFASEATNTSGFLSSQNDYRGFYWFENTTKKKETLLNQEYQMPSPEEAAHSIEERRKRLDDARNQMIEVGFDKSAPVHVKRDAIIAYKTLELEMWNGVIDLAENSDMANFINPELADNLSQPTNVFGAKLQRKLDAEKSSLEILTFAKDYDLLLFVSPSCAYSREFLPVLKSFADTYHFQFEISSLDSEVGKSAKALGIKNVPTLVAIKKDGSKAFEISRGMVSFSHLEASILLAKKYSEELASNILKTQKYNFKRQKHHD